MKETAMTRDKYDMLTFVKQLYLIFPTVIMTIRLFTKTSLNAKRSWLLYFTT